jgi:hypothetical protein
MKATISRPVLRYSMAGTIDSWIADFAQLRDGLLALRSNDRGHFPPDPGRLQ